MKTQRLVHIYFGEFQYRNNIEPTTIKHQLKDATWYCSYESYVMKLTEKQLSELMHYLDEDGNMTVSIKEQMQRAGKNVFGWE